MPASILHRRLLLSGATLAGALTGYGGRAYAQCANAGGSTYQCGGANTTTQTVTANDAEVTTLPGFSVDTSGTGGDAITITGDGAISYTDANASPLTATEPYSAALEVRATGDNGATPGSITIDTNGALTGGGFGIDARSYGSGATTVTVNGDVTATSGQGIIARRGSDLTVTTGAGTTVSGSTDGIFADLNTGALTVIANGNVTGTSGSGILACTAGTSVAVTTGADSTVAGGYGIYACNFGGGAMTITANGDVTGTSGAGIYAHYSYGADFTVTTGVGGTITGDTHGIIARHQGSGALTITANGDVTGTSGEGINAENSAAGADLTVTTGVGTTVTGATDGIRALNYGSGNLIITADGSVTGMGGFSSSGIRASNLSAGADLIVTTGVGTTVVGSAFGIDALNQGTGATTVIANGDVTATGSDAIRAQNSSLGPGTDVTVMTGAGTTITGDNNGIYGRNYGSGALTVTVQGNVIGESFAGINVVNRAGSTDLSVFTGAGTSVTGRDEGISARNQGSGALTIEVHGDVVGGLFRDGVFASHAAGGPIDITVGATGAVTSQGGQTHNFAIDVSGGAGNAIIAGTLNGGAGGALQFDQATALDDRLELHPTAVVNGLVLAGPGSDTLAFAGAGAGAFNLDDIDTGADTQQYRGFEAFEVNSGVWAFTGATTVGFTVNGGTIRANGTAGAVDVLSGGVLGGSGTVGTTIVADGGAIAPGNSPGALDIMGDLTLSGGSILDFELGDPGGVAGVDSDLINVSGNLTLDGALNITDIGGFGEGVYRIINYSGVLTDNGLDFGLLPAGFTLGDLTVQTSVASQVNLAVSAPSGFAFWDGANMTGDGAIAGGTSVWNAANGNWTTLDGGTNGAFAPGGLLVFQGAPGVVTVDNSLGAVSTIGMQFAVDGYRIEGDALTLDGAATIRVGDGTAAGADYSTVIASNLVGAASLEKTDLGTLILAGDNTFTGGTTISAGTLQLGDGGTGGSIAGDIANNATLAFNRSDDATFDGVISGAGAIRQIGSGLTNLTGDSSGFAGATSVEAGALAVNGALCGDVNVFSGGRLQGTGVVCDTNNFNGGAVAPGNSIGTLTVDGDYVGDGGTLEIEAVLGGDASPSDLLVITGATSGETNVQVINLGGMGAETVEGIRIVDVGGASDGVFTLIGDYVFEGEQAVIAGAYAYRLRKNGVSTPADGDWYLRSTLDEAPVDPVEPPSPLYQAGVPLYEAYPQALLALNETPTLRQRTGARQWKNGVWGRAEGALRRARPETSTSGTDYDIDTGRLEAGVDVPLHESDGGVLVGGLVANYAQSFTDVSSVFGAGDIDTAAYGAGATLTWHGENGFYADLQGRANWYDSEIESDTIGWTLDNDGKGQAASLEFGRRVRVGAGFAVVPQMQHVYSRVDFDAFADPAGAVVSREAADSFRGRYGIALDYSSVSEPASGKARGLHAYAIANLYYEFLEGARVDVSGAQIASEDEPLWGGLGLGASFDWNERFSLYGEASADTTLNGFGDSRRLTARAGLRAAF